MTCPSCHRDLDLSPDSVKCRHCHTAFPIKNGIPFFAEFQEEMTADAEFQAAQMFNTSFVAKLTRLGKKIINSEYKPKDHVQEFINDIDHDAIIVELGSGNRRLRENVINVDLFPFPNVDVVANIESTPFRDSSVDFAILDTVLEHVPEPHRVVKEIHRILKPGGKIVCITPWIFPYHGYPRNYFNISSDGLRFLFRDFSECTIEMNMGPSSALTNIISEYFAVALSGNRKFLYSFFKGLFLLPVFFFKFIDTFWLSSDKSLRISATLCALVKK